MKPLPTAPNAEAKAARVPKDANPVHQPRSRNPSTSSQQTVPGQHPSLRQLSGPTEPDSPGQHPALRQPTITLPGPQPGSRHQSISDPEPSPVQHQSPIQHYSPMQNGVPRRRAPSTDWNTPNQDNNPNISSSSKDWTQSSMASPLIEEAMSARRVSPVMRMHSTERLPTMKSPESSMPPSQPDRAPPIPARAASRRQSLREHGRSVDDGTPTLIGRDRQGTEGEEKSKLSEQLKEDNDQSGTDLPIQTPAETDPLPPSSKTPPIIKRVPSHRITIMSTASDYSGSMESPVTREVSPEMHRNSKGFVPGHQTYGSLTFLPMHPLLSPIDPSDSWAADAEKEFERRTSDPPKARSPAQQLPKPQPIPAPDDSEGAVNTSHPLLLADRHTRFSSRTNPPTPRNVKDLPLRHYHSQDALRLSKYSPSDEKEVFVPPKRSSSLVYGLTDRAPSTLINSSTSLPIAAALSPPPNSSSAAPSPLNVTQTQRSLTPQPTNVLKSSKASIVTGPSSVESLTTASAPSEGATPPAIPRSRTSMLSHSKSTPNLTAPPSELDPSERSVSDDKLKPTATNNAPFYLNPISSAALIDFLASTPPPSPPGRRARSPSNQATRGKHGPTKDHPGPFSIFPASPAPPSPGGRAMASFSQPHDCDNGAPASTAAASSPAENKKGFKKFFGGVGSKKSKASKPPPTEGLSIVIPEHERYRTKKRNGKKDNSAGAIEGKKDGEGEGGGFMGVGRDGVWISRKNFLKT